VNLSLIAEASFLNFVLFIDGKNKRERNARTGAALEQSKK
jgi:hypothetical protein